MITLKSEEIICCEGYFRKKPLHNEIQRFYSLILLLKKFSNTDIIHPNNLLRT